jgi:capsular exopolysaccharide synthesis family protein
MMEANISTKDGPMVSVQRYWHIILKWKWTALFFFLAVAGGVTVFSFLAHPVYTARGSLWIEDQLNILPFAEVQKFDSYSAPTTYSQLLLSRTLAAKTIENHKLYENLKFVGKPPKGKKLPPPSDPVFREQLIEKLISNISLKPIGGTRLLEVTFSARDPEFASGTLNALFDEYIDLIIRQRYMASDQATQFLKNQIAAVRSEIEESEKKLGDYGSAKNILPLSTAETPTIARLSEVNKALTDATIERIKKYDYYNQLKSGLAGEMADTTKESPVQKLREQYTTLSRDYSRRLATLKPEYPDMQRLKSELDSVKEALQNETQNMVGAAFSDYQAALKQEQSLKGLLDQLRDEAFKANSNSIVYNSLRVELDNKKTLLEALSKRQNETDVSSRLTGTEATNVWIVDRANLPLRPTSPNKRKNVLTGFLVGLAGALGLAIGIEYLNSSVKTSKDVANSTGFPTLGVIPSFDVETKSKSPKSEFARLINIISGTRESKEKRSRRRGNFNTFPPNASSQGQDNHDSSRGIIELITSREPQSIQAESYRSIRTTLLVSSPPGKIKAILVTSPLAREGKSVTISNLGITLAQANKRVVIVDADLRRPKQSKIFGLNSGWGLTHFVSSFIDAPDLVRPTQFPNLFLISSGPIPASPIELLTSEKMDHLIAFLKRSFDYILFDSPPILAVSDALAMGPMVDGVILVVRAGRTPVPALRQARQRLDTHKLKCLGVILNGVNLIEQDGYYAKQYYQYSKPE